jgi:hypothetical protein
MSQYTNIKVNVSEGQKDKIKRAVQAGTGIRLTHGDLSGEHILALTQAQINKMTKAYQSGTGMTIKMSKTQLHHNVKVEGGFLGAILPVLATAGKFLLSSVLPSLATGALSGLGSAATTKIFDKISGSGVLYVKKGGMNCKVIPAGSGLYLAPWRKGSSITASGLYMKTGSGIYTSGDGLLLGENSPFKNIPILGMIL